MSESYGEDYLAYLSQRSPIRRFVRQLYLRTAASYFTRPVIDIGCGIGTLLERLPNGSFGLEVNRSAVKFCRSKGLDVRLFDPAISMTEVLLNEAKGKSYDFVCSHVLEHLPDPASTLAQILAGGNRIGAQRGLIIVPGAAGFRSDKTHVSFLEVPFFETHVPKSAGWEIERIGYFPIGMKVVSGFFTHNELRVQLKKAD